MISSIVFDEEMGHLKVSDIRKMVNHLQPFIEDNEEDEAEEKEEDLNRFIL